MNYFFGKKKAVAPKDAIVKLRENIAMLEKREAHLQASIDKELRTARLNASRNRPVALAAIKRKKQLESQIEKIRGSHTTLDTLALHIEGANIHVETIKTIEQATDALKGIHKETTAAQVDTIMDDLQEQISVSNELSDAVSNYQMFGIDVDDDELNAELDLLEQEQADQELLKVSTPAGGIATTQPAVSIPQIPQTIPAGGVAVEEDDDEELLAELRQNMGITA
ncbi:hypothetical protein GQ42DRAFT_162228 [Ramicandelaber brevisporus]|nr:hypothetical protein GQ42DRAFT_162228 [Ramicandelaber brevisporus]